ncbi:MAG: sigma-70 family RNA polymerase sigma factor [Thermodesulfobacteria bacterium]|nr:sigma-70 family RNA polymerase sigma factor [Thermodesulfobacteriota bacterium]
METLRSLVAEDPKLCNLKTFVLKYYLKKNEVSGEAKLSDYGKYIFPLLKGERVQNFPKFETKVKRLIKKTFKNHFTPEIEKLFQKYYGDTYIEDIFQEFLIRLIQTKDLILNLDFVHEKYLVKIIENLIYRQLSSNFKFYNKKVSLENFPYVEEDVVATDAFPSYTYDYTKRLKIVHWTNVLSKRLKKPEQEVLCCYLYKSFLNKEFPTEFSSSAVYKRWERLKKKLKNVLGRELKDEGLEELKDFFEFYVSEVCEKMYYKKIGMKE